MIIGQTLFSNNDGTTKTYYSPWFPRGGAGADFVIDVLALSTNAQITVYVETKNSENDDAAPGGAGVTAVNDSGAITSAGQTEWLSGRDIAGGALDSSASGLLELVRFKYIVVKTAGTAIVWVHFRMLNPAWLTDGA